MTPVTIFVLWIYLSTPSSLYGIPIGSGWHSRAVFWDQEACALAIENGKFLLRHDPEAKIICLPPNELPPGPIAEHLTLDDLPEEEEFGSQKLREQKKIEI